MCEKCDDPDDPVEGFPEHGNEDPDDNPFEVERTATPQDFIAEED